ncbi:type I-E CRISPR-associated protein Cas6/Cse3/CasE [Gluconacetobacter takamatsuzukensis]|uniref:Type I-E CRISPR-associated protein Cas6/Cse3/CasE n=1 Tax=Gluconacetobacter takamatsuzukensis TaxID=1286190 RepID=A0A7W4KAT5_9PROT|nr:type I-E CRISPR-associated protein Cas6/Cse3/CasE [Gluconacetobacter takamatsuzukensis]MBB2203480.1 type I-E CRISPR-associated protein Cas6/Cse3/CasE [Gluconacetobacter takamatsuzukensis]
MMTPILSRVALRRDAPVQAFARLLVPEGQAQQHGAAHHLLWALFGDTPDRDRDFLWRQVEPGRYMVLSARPPMDTHGLFAIESRPFAPVLHEGDRLRFLLRANATVDRKMPGKTRSQRHDVVMDALHHLPRDKRAPARVDAVASAAAAWLERQGARSGFVPEAPVTVEAYDVLRIARAGAPRVSFGVVDLTGDLMVAAPADFVATLLRGFGRARAFGCGLMLIRRAG